VASSALRQERRAPLRVARSVQVVAHSERLNAVRSTPCPAWERTTHERCALQYLGLRTSAGCSNRNQYKGRLSSPQKIIVESASISSRCDSTWQMLLSGRKGRRDETQSPRPLPCATCRLYVVGPASTPSGVTTGPTIRSLPVHAQWERFPDRYSGNSTAAPKATNTANSAAGMFGP